MHALFWQCSVDFSRFHVQNTLFLILIDILQKSAPKELLKWIMAVPITFNSPKSSRSAVSILKFIHILCVWGIYSTGTEGQAGYCESMSMTVLETCHKLPRLSFNYKNTAGMQNSERVLGRESVLCKQKWSYIS